MLVDRNWFLIMKQQNLEIWAMVGSGMIVSDSTF